GFWILVTGFWFEPPPETRTSNPPHVYAAGSSSPYSHSALIGPDPPGPNRSGSKDEMSMLFARPSSRSSERTRPIAGEILNPIPEKPQTMYRPRTPGVSPRRGRKSGLTS